MSTFDPTTGTFTGTFTVGAPSGDVLVHDASSEPKSGGFTWKLAYAATPASDGSPANPNYVDDRWALGLNVGVLGAKDDSSRPYVALHWDSKFYAAPTDSLPSSAIYLQTIDSNGISRRPFSWSARYDGTGSTFVLRGDYVAYQKADAHPMVNFNFGAGAGPGSVFFNDGIVLSFQKNNVPVASQMNAAGTASIPLPYLDQNDDCVFVRPITGTAGGGPVKVINAAVGGSSVLEASAPNAAAATISLTSGQGTAAKTASIGVDASGNLVFRQVTTGGATYFDFNGTSRWRDRSAGFAERMAITATSAQFGVPLKAPSYTVSTLPRASIAGAGALVYVTDAAGGPTFACSDGSKWRVVAPLGAVVS